MKFYLNSISRVKGVVRDVRDVCDVQTAEQMLLIEYFSDPVYDKCSSPTVNVEDKKVSGKTSYWVSRFWKKQRIDKWLCQWGVARKFSPTVKKAIKH